MSRQHHAHVDVMAMHLKKMLDMAGLRGIMAAMCKLLSPNLLKQAF